MPTHGEKPIRVLLVDDHKTVLWGLSKLINGESPKLEVVATASNRADAFAVSRSERPDLILLDIDLGGENSLDFLPALLAESGAKVLILTGTRDPELHDRAVMSGARGVVLKTEEAEVILAAIRKVHGGELWLDRASTARVFNRMSTAGSSQQPDPDAVRIATLTPREREIIRAIVQEGGSTNRKIADRLNVSEHTLRNHLSSIYDKLEVENRLELFMYALKHNLGKTTS